MDEWVRQAQAWSGQAESWVRQHPPEQIYVSAAVVALTILVLIAGADSNLTSSRSAFCTVPDFGIDSLVPLKKHGKGPFIFGKMS
jgi:hypothetical protein